MHWKFNFDRFEITSPSIFIARILIVSLNRKSTLPALFKLTIAQRQVCINTISSPTQTKHIEYFLMANYHSLSLNIFSHDLNSFIKFKITICTQKKNLIESKKIICLEDFLWFKEIIYLNKLKFYTKKVSLNRITMFSNRINFCLKAVRPRKLDFGQK